MFDKLKKNKFLLIIMLIAIWKVLSEISLTNIFLSLCKIMTPVIIGFFFAFVINIPLNAFERLILKYVKPSNKLKRVFIRTTSLTLAVFTVSAIIFLAFFIAFPQIKQTLTQILNMLSKWSESMSQITDGLGKLAPELALKIKNINTSEIIEQLMSKLGISADVNSTFVFVESTLSTLTDVVIGFILSLYILFQKEKLSIHTKKALFAFLPEIDAEYILRIAGLSNQCFSGFVRGQLAGAFIIGTLFLIVLNALAFPQALMISIVIGFFALIPILGGFVGLIFGVCVTATVDIQLVPWFALTYIVVQQLEDNFIYPRVMGKAVGLNGFWVLLAVSLGGGLWGITGILLAVPVTSIIYTIVSDYIDYFIKQKNIPPQRYV